jgi:hypothetical protein
MNRAPIVVILALVAAPASAQIKAPGEETSRNVRVMSHIPLGERFTTGDIEIEQELSRPYVYVARTVGHAGFDIVSIRVPSRAERIYSWRVTDEVLHAGIGGSDVHYFKLRGRYYTVLSLQFLQSGPDADVAAGVFDVTGLPDTTGIREVAQIRTKYQGYFGGFHTVFPYKHSDGRTLLFGTTLFTSEALIYDLEKLVNGTPAEKALIGRVPQLLHDFYIAYDPATKQDKFYGAGRGGCYVYDVTRPEEPQLLTSITGVAGLAGAHTFQVSPDGRYGVAQAEYQTAPVRLFDLKPGLEGTVKTISRPIGAWAGNWKLASHNHEMRWPYVFIAAFEDGLQVVNMMDPTNPYTVGYYDTHSGSLLHGTDPGTTNWNKPVEGNEIFNGLWGVDVRNADGLIVVSDFRTGFWSFKMDGFDGWNGHQWGMPNISSAQDWDNGPDGAPKAQKVSFRLNQ